MSRRLVEPRQPRRRLVTADEIRVWKAVVQDAAPLPGRSLPDEAQLPPDDAPEPVASKPPPPGNPPQRPSAHPPPPSRHGQAELHHGNTPGLDRRSAERMKRGEMEIEAVLDLHGHTQEVAHAELIAFVQRCWNAQRRCILVVTGKGSQGFGILRAQVPRWLNQSPVRERILGFSYARPRHGGDGALYVLIRRQRT
ncbi:MAG: Smr/MutS family protein [Magnetospirillum sp.]|nr:Smr/MutS family protein [Magnetospirillum sp.]